ncbi:DUF3422 domain-containing protein [Oxalobacteraceae bacterium R-40]|uniref:DUF3422 domain-containing protein n=1 Tax=Keguizhuia sedimenti TaxID=3064264 RepID=A0ABU1BRZ6_9BURK|nr:DUF3422 domain-containing protein [Oxalobacteraceae bacterium R-40]
MTSATYLNLSHPLRVPLAAEIHSRPFMRLQAPTTLTHFAVYLAQSGDELIDNTAGQHAILVDLCAHFGVTGPSVGAKHFFHDFGRFALKWECHTEFATYMFTQARDRQVPLQEVFSHVPLAQIPQQWLLSLQGKIMGASHVALVTKDIESEDIEAELRTLFEGAMVVGSNLLERAQIYTDFLIQSDGFSRFLVRDVGLRDLQAGRLAQRLLEIETYRIMALLSLPHVQRATPALNVIEDELAELAVAMVNADEAADHDSDDEQDMLRSITALAARIERLSLDNTYRFSASQAYYRLVRARIEELRETRMEGRSTIEEFIDRRLGPAMNTFTSVAQRQEALAKRIANTNDLLRTRVGIVQEQHNRNILQSMNRRAALQLRLQQAVEGLSVVAISYYASGLIGYIAKAAKSIGWPVNPDLATGALLPVVLIAVWVGLRKLHKGNPRHEAEKP